jgi:hypothetical protein
MAISGVDRVTQGSLIPVWDRANEALRIQLVQRLADGRWHYRMDLAVGLGVSVRAIRDAASHAGGEVLSGQQGIKLTCCATPDELTDALGRLRSQVREMQRRLLETEQAWHRREKHSA